MTFKNNAYERDKNLELLNERISVNSVTMIPDGLRILDSNEYEHR